MMILNRKKKMQQRNGSRRKKISCKSSNKKKSEIEHRITEESEERKGSGNPLAFGEIERKREKEGEQDEVDAKRDGGWIFLLQLVQLQKMLILSIAS